MSGTQLLFVEYYRRSCHHVLAVDGDTAIKSWSMIDEWSSEVTLAVKRMMTQVSTVHRFFLVILCAFSVHESC